MLFFGCFPTSGSVNLSNYLWISGKDLVNIYNKLNFKSLFEYYYFISINKDNFVCGINGFNFRDISLIKMMAKLIPEAPIIKIILGLMNIL